MKLNDVRKFAIRERVRIRFPISNGLVCSIDERGIGRVAELRSVPSFNLEEEFARAAQFSLEPVASSSKFARERTVSRQELEALAQGAAAPSSQDTDHEE
ncbi:MAG: hypothetical protein IRZ15_08255 [Bryobacteraceae bacterium]|nr:hypothetical protein [Bryobacteraceae bacterium]